MRELCLYTDVQDRMTRLAQRQTAEILQSTNIEARTLTEASIRLLRQPEFYIKEYTRLGLLTQDAIGNYYLAVENKLYNFQSVVFADCEGRLILKIYVNSVEEVLTWAMLGSASIVLRPN